MQGLARCHDRQAWAWVVGARCLRPAMPGRRSRWPSGSHCGYHPLRPCSSHACHRRASGPEGAGSGITRRRGPGGRLVARRLSSPAPRQAPCHFRRLARRNSLGDQALSGRCQRPPAAPDPATALACRDTQVSTTIDRDGRTETAKRHGRKRFTRSAILLQKFGSAPLPGNCSVPLCDPGRAQRSG